MHKIKRANPPNPNLQTETSTPDIPDSLTKNSELAWPQTPKKAAKYAKIINVLLLRFINYNINNIKLIAFYNF